MHILMFIAALGYWLAGTSTASADYVTVGVWLASVVGATLTAEAAAVVGYLAVTAVTIGAGLLVSALATPAAPKPQERQQTIRSTVAPRVRYYGRNLVGGLQTFWDTAGSKLYSQIAINWGKISQVRALYLNDQVVTVNASGVVQEAQYKDTRQVDNGFFGGGIQNIPYQCAELFVKDGDPNQTVHASLDSAFTEVTSDHRMRGVANILGVFDEVPRDIVAKVYGNGVPQIRALIDGSLIKSVRTGATIYSDNPADVIYDALTGKDSAGFAYCMTLAESQVDLASFQAYANICDEAVPLAAGGTEKRYRLWGGFDLTDEPKNVLARMCSTCDADLYINSAGKVAIRGGKFTSPTLTLDSDKGHIVAGEFRQGTGSLAAFNELNFTFLSPTDYLEVEGDRWLDSANVTLRGKVLSQNVPLAMVPSHSQARRLAKILTHKANPTWSGKIITSFYGFNALDENMVRIKFAPLSIDATFRVDGARVLEGLTGVELTVSSLTATVYNWDPATEEGTAPGSTATASTPVSLTPPADFHASAADKVIGGSSVGTILAITWTEPSRTSLSQEVQYRPASDTNWLAANVADAQGYAETGTLTVGASYEVRARTLSPAGAVGAWGTYLTVTATADTTTPVAPTGVTGTGGTGTATIAATHSASNNAVGTRIYRNTVNNFATSTVVTTMYGSPSTLMSYADTVAAGTYYYFVTAINGSGTVSTNVAIGAVVVS